MAVRAWVDASAGVAGDMLLGALVDAGADPAVLQRAVDAVVPGAVRLRVEEVVRGGLRAVKAHVDVLVDDPPHRTWRDVRALLEGAGEGLSPGAGERALAVFGRLADAEGRVHGVPAQDVHFHEVGALDAVADVVGTAAALDLLGVDDLVVSAVATGAGRVRAAHGALPVPGPAVLAMTVGWDVVAGVRPGEEGELATPTGVALVTALASASGPLPALRVVATGTGAGTRDVPGRANVVRVVLGTPTAPSAAAGREGDRDLEDALLLEATVDDLDPRVWPEVVADLLSRGALDAWLVPVLGKKGRPAHVLTVLADPGHAEALSWAVMTGTSTLGVRRSAVRRDVLDRAWSPVAVPGRPGTGRSGGEVRVKVGHRGGVVVQAMPEFTDVVALAERTGEPVATALVRARAAAVDAGLVAGAPWPPARG
ncbi:nickel pincer cofactor biosynthesis protein LarC [Pseudokineococcus basanitobsidens]|uniref:Pyridinium-3,5-bisthiocarboxylic acid mononucleotide nickel insertion protein n=1 Tax=Pseudokineococcus basanitobsidens TaxID=1926649 RepID=A0ABU8RFE5_9ACTN